MPNPDSRKKILVVDDELSMREVLEFLLQKEGYAPFVAENGTQAVEMINKDDYDLILTDIRLGDITGIEVLRESKKKNPDAPVIMISAYATTEKAVEAMNDGAYDFVPKPFDNKELLKTIEKAVSLSNGQKNSNGAGKADCQTLHFGRIVANSPKMKKILEMVKQVAQTKTNILITGESGTGKELIARSIHELSDRKDHPFVVVNCGGIPENLMESEFFGHKKGSFTGATNDKKGLFETAHYGTIFLDEIGDLPMGLQVKLLRAVQERVFKPVGGTNDITVDIRIISATNKSLEKEVIEGNFREDLFYRLNVIELKLPPLRERKDDLKILAQHFVDKYSKEMEKRVEKISSYAIDLLSKYTFPGNIRELENLIERSVALSTTNIILPESLSLSTHKRRWIEGVEGRRFDLDDVEHGVSLDEILENIEAAYFRKALKCSNGSKKEAATLLGLTFRTFRYRLSKLDIES